MGKKQNAFSLIELLAVAAILVILAAAAIPAYLNYNIEAKVGNLWKQADPARLALTSDYLKNDIDPTSQTIASGARTFTTSNLDYVRCITIQNGIVSVVADPDTMQGKDIWIAWQPVVTDDILEWNCTYSADAADYINEACDQYSCTEFTAWSDPSEVYSEEIWYLGSFTIADAQRELGTRCKSDGVWETCSRCYDFIDTDTESRYVDTTVRTETVNYGGGLEVDDTWTGDALSAWTYDLTYTVATYTCYERTRSQNSCASLPAASFTNDGNCT